jgi:TorA maturation chaperone TorD
MNVATPTHSQIATIYRFCAQSMHYPSGEWFCEKYLSALSELLRSLGAGEELDTLQQAINADANSLETLQVEYTRLFITGVPHVAAPPYASVYLDKTLKGRFSEEITGYYHKAGYTLNDHVDLPDNIIHQLEFLSLLVEDGKTAMAEEFIRRFIWPWFPIFSSRVKEEAKHPFYPVIISIIDFFTKEEEEYGV